MGLVVVFLRSYGIAVWLALSAGGLGQGVSDSLGENLRGTRERRGCLLVALLRLAGVPPFLGFYAKVMVLMASGAPLSGVFVLLAAVSSVFLLYMYLRLFYFLVTGRLLEGLVSLAGTSG